MQRVAMQMYQGDLKLSLKNLRTKFTSGVGEWGWWQYRKWEWQNKTSFIYSLNVGKDLVGIGRRPCEVQQRHVGIGIGRILSQLQRGLEQTAIDPLLESGWFEGTLADSIVINVVPGLVFFGRHFFVKSVSVMLESLHSHTPTHVMGMASSL